MDADKETRYVSLINSLPFHGPLFHAKHTPLSRYQLNQRLSLLTSEDAATLQHLLNILDWKQISMSQSDEVIVRSASRLLSEIDQPFVRHLFLQRMEIRTLVSALRQKHHGKAAPNQKKLWGVGRWVQHIRRNWRAPGFNLQNVFPWVIEAEKLLAAGNSLEFEKLILGAVWRELDTLSDGHHFDFEAVIIYVMRWNLVARWTSYNGESAAQVFDKLTEDGLTKFTHLFSDPVSL